MDTTICDGNLCKDKGKWIVLHCIRPLHSFLASEQGGGDSNSLGAGGFWLLLQAQSHQMPVQYFMCISINIHFYSFLFIIKGVSVLTTSQPNTDSPSLNLEIQLGFQLGMSTGMFWCRLFILCCLMLKMWGLQWLQSTNCHPKLHEQIKNIYTMPLY